MANVIELIRKDHEAVSELFSHYETAEQPYKQGFVDQITADLKKHANAEEVTVYPKLSTDLRQHSTIEHQDIKKLVERLDAKDGNQDELISELKKCVEHHVAEEEEKIFPELESKGLDLDEIGKAFEEQKA